MDKKSRTELGKGFSDARANETRRRVRQADLIAEMTYLFHTPPDNISLLTLPLTSKIPASVLFDLIVRVSRYLRSR